VSDDDPRWRSPEASHGFETGFENGSAAEELRADAYDCIMVRSLRTYRIQGCGAMIPRPMAKLPSDHRPDHNQRVSPCSGLSRRGLETTDRAARAERRPTLTGPARVDLNTCGSGRRNGIPSRTKKLE
jgi:hypothetical protein